uniref:Ig-like domain-containing protein n=1 Tax=Cyclopterus lumpus TaxID=8103 RepID=A0A8C3A997_CYCLU
VTFHIGCNATQTGLWSGLTDGRDVNQTPLLWEVEGQSATMDCSHIKDISYRQMYWYRQLPGETMKLVVYTVADTEPDFEPDFRGGRFSATKPDAHSGTFTVENLQPEDNGLYFCAVSQHSDTGSLTS